MIYEFECTECNIRWEEIQPMKKDEHVSSCPNCSKICKSLVTGGAGFAFMDRKGNPVKGFPDNDRAKEKEQKKIEKELDATLPPLPKKAVQNAHKKILNARKNARKKP